MHDTEPDHDRHEAQERRLWVVDEDDSAVEIPADATDEDLRAIVNGSLDVQHLPTSAVAIAVRSSFASLEASRATSLSDRQLWKILGDCASEISRRIEEETDMDLSGGDESQEP